MKPNFQCSSAKRGQPSVLISIFFKKIWVGPEKRDYRNVEIVPVGPKATFREAIDLAPPRQGRKKVALRLPEERIT
jgi:hypothetical protein